MTVSSRWLLGQSPGLEDVTTPVLLRYSAACREARLPGRPGPTVVDPWGRLDGYVPATINRRLVAVSGMFAFREMLDPTLPNPVPKGCEVHRVTDNPPAYAVAAPPAVDHSSASAPAMVRRGWMSSAC
ncbi:hypothetical protein [Nocardia sp. CA-119907]|uniref:hypothetical protein n=1 Tax=Nocardia sp. CA-119907 TaxID=3239973 RepID=UPI003D9533FD